MFIEPLNEASAVDYKRRSRKGAICEESPHVCVNSTLSRENEFTDTVTHASMFEGMCDGLSAS